MSLRAIARICDRAGMLNVAHEAATICEAWEEHVPKKKSTRVVSTLDADPYAPGGRLYWIGEQHRKPRRRA